MSRRKQNEELQLQSMYTALQAINYVDKLLVYHADEQISSLDFQNMKLPTLDKIPPSLQTLTDELRKLVPDFDA